MTRGLRGGDKAREDQGRTWDRGDGVGWGAEGWVIVRSASLDTMLTATVMYFFTHIWHIFGLQSLKQEDQAINANQILTTIWLDELASDKVLKGKRKAQKLTFRTTPFSPSLRALELHWCGCPYTSLFPPPLLLYLHISISSPHSHGGNVVITQTLRGYTFQSDQISPHKTQEPTQ